MADKRGRPTRYTRALADYICDQLMLGRTLRSICRDDDMPGESTVRQWAAKDLNGFYAHYARARDIGLDAMAEDIFEISDNASNDYMEREDPDNPGFNFNGEHVQRSRLRVESRKWYLSKMAPKRYGDKLEVEHGVNDQLADRLMQARKRAQQRDDGNSGGE